MSDAYVSGAELFGYDRLAQYSRSTQTIAWDDARLARVVRLKLVTDHGLPFADVSYCYGELADGTPVRVRLPFHQLPRKNLRGTIVGYAQTDGIHAKRLGILDAVAFD